MLKSNFINTKKSILRMSKYLSMAFLATVLMIVSCSEDDVKLSPTITSFSPESGIVGTEVTITGINLAEVTEVNIGDVKVDIDSQTDTSIIVTIGSSVGTGTIKVVGPGGIATSRNDFIMHLNPIIASFSPESGIVGTKVTITGTNLSAVTQVSIGDVILNIDSQTETAIIVTINSNVETGKLRIVGPGGSVMSETEFILYSPLTISSFSPGLGIIGSEVTINGTALLSVTEVLFGDIAATIKGGATDTEIKVDVPEGLALGDVKIKLTNAYGSVESENSFTVEEETPLAITSFSPTSGDIGTEVTINGTALLSVTEVKFGDIATTINSGATDTEIKVNVPEGLAYGDVKITLTNEKGSVESETNFTVEEPAPSFEDIVIATFEEDFDPGFERRNWFWQGDMEILEAQVDPTNDDNMLLRLKANNGSAGAFGAGDTTQEGVIGVKDSNIENVYINVDVWAEDGFTEDSQVKIYLGTDDGSEWGWYANYFLDINWTGKKTISIPVSYFKKDGVVYEQDITKLDVLGFEASIPVSGITSVYIDNLIITQGGKKLGEVVPEK